MNPRLEWITKLLDRHAVPCFLDSGTLLGVVREGDVLGHDKDIDLAIWQEHEGLLMRVLPEVEKAGFRVVRPVYDKKTTAFKFVHREGGLEVTIGIFRRHGPQAWRMGTYVTSNPYPRGSLRFFLVGVWRFPIRQANRALAHVVPLKWLVRTWPFRTTFRVGVWIVPLDLVEPTVRHEPTGLPVPKKWGEYLTLRYGDWRVPVRDWVWYRHDGAVRLGPPERVLGQR